MFWWKKSATQNNHEAQHNLGLYNNGIGIKQDFQKAKYWYKKAAAQDDTFAQTNLGKKTRWKARLSQSKILV